MILGFDLALRSVVRKIFTATVSMPTLICRATVEDRLLRKESGEGSQQLNLRHTLGL